MSELCRTVGTGLSALSHIKPKMPGGKCPPYKLHDMPLEFKCFHCDGIRVYDVLDLQKPDTRHCKLFEGQKFVFCRACGEVVLHTNSCTLLCRSRVAAPMPGVLLSPLLTSQYSLTPRALRLRLLFVCARRRSSSATGRKRSA